MKKLALVLCALMTFTMQAMEDDDGCVSCFGCFKMYFGQLSLYVTMQRRVLNKEIDYRVANDTTDITDEMLIRTENGDYWKHDTNTIRRAYNQEIIEATKLLDVITDRTGGYNRSNGSHTLRFSNGDYATYHQSPKSHAGWDITKKK